MSKHRHRSSKRQRQQQARQNQMIALGVFVVLIIAGGILALTNNSGGTSTVSQERLDLDPVRGNPDAPVTIVEYSSYGCPSCRMWEQSGAVEDILTEFAGQVKFIHRDFPVISPAYDYMAANVAQCALDQGQDQFWALHHAFHNDVRMGSSEETLLQTAARIGLDGAALRACAEAETHTATVRYDEERGRALGLRGAPAFFVNDRQLVSPRPEDVRAAVLAALERS